ncbi:hypothetical protein OS493_023426 [Desmophyllum pertusum]|uniref:Uncharacterized protein n=1 Tax=Desmophyllum pertusum TaxID=174260 RepID=A0A9X0D1V8_9CNID|nr:hypothetical protein OS493_023426 [Desmophyllum pertusum]
MKIIIVSSATKQNIRKVRETGQKISGETGCYSRCNDVEAVSMPTSRFHGSKSTISNVWIPRWTDPFSKDLLPTDVPSLLHGLPDEDVMSDDEMDEEGADPGFKEIPVPTPEMVRAQFPTAESVLGDQDQQVTSQLSEMMLHTGGNTKMSAATSAAATASFVPREKREKELNEFLRQRQNRVGTRIKQRIQSINDAMSSSNLELK